MRLRFSSGETLPFFEETFLEGVLSSAGDPKTFKFCCCAPRSRRWAEAQRGSPAEIGPWGPTAVLIGAAGVVFGGSKSERGFFKSVVKIRQQPPHLVPQFI
jgi:hypothetical protein